MNATKVYAGLDIHATNTVIKSINGQGSRLTSKRFRRGPIGSLAGLAAIPAASFILSLSRVPMPDG